MSFDYNAAEKAVLDVLATAGKELQVKLLIAEVVEQDFGWVFLYETLDARVTANSVLVFDKSDGLVYVPGTATGIDSSIEQYRRGIKTRA